MFLYNYNPVVLGVHINLQGSGSIFAGRGQAYIDLIDQNKLWRKRPNDPC